MKPSSPGLVPRPNARLRHFLLVLKVVWLKFYFIYLKAMAVTLNLIDILQFCKSELTSRCFREGEQVLLAKHLVAIGKSHLSKPTVIKVHALCLQTSALASAPHNLTATLLRQDQVFNIKEAECSCAAGLSGCKHIMAMLLHMNRYVCKLEAG